MLVVALSAHVLARQRARAELVRPAVLLLLIVMTQFTLGAWTVLSEKQVAINTAHVATGALLFVTSVVMGLRVHRDRFHDRGLPCLTAHVDSFGGPGRLTARLEPVRMKTGAAAIPTSKITRHRFSLPDESHG